MKTWFRVRLKKHRPWLWRLTHPRQIRRVNRWLREVEAALHKDMEKPFCPIWRFNKNPNEIYGRSPYLEDLKYFKAFNNQLLKTLREADDRIHKEIMGPGPEKFTGLENRFKEKP